MPDKTRDVRIAKTTILARGWSEKMITELLPEPETRKNPHGAQHPPMKLWLEKDVLAAEKTDAFKEMNAKHIAAKEKRASRLNEDGASRREFFLSDMEKSLEGTNDATKATMMLAFWVDKLEKLIAYYNKDRTTIRSQMKSLLRKDALAVCLLAKSDLSTVSIYEADPCTYVQACEAHLEHYRIERNMDTYLYFSDYFRRHRKELEKCKECNVAGQIAEKAPFYNRYVVDVLCPDANVAYRFQIPQFYGMKVLPSAESLKEASKTVSYQHLKREYPFTKRDLRTFPEEIIVEEIDKLCDELRSYYSNK